MDPKARGVVNTKMNTKYLYCFGSLEHNNLRPVWVSVCFIDLGELDRRAVTEGLQAWELGQNHLRNEGFITQDQIR
jgi:hypothetical protein